MRQWKIGTRGSKLAIDQSNLLIAQIKEQYPEFGHELVTITTTGDKILSQSLDKIGGKGVFVKELDRALAAGETDLSIHSLKDVPADLPEDLPLVALSRREDPRDVLVLPEGQEFDRSKPVGCSSKRRTIQFLQLYPEVDIRPVRGNVLSRLRKLDSGEYGALILAAAGMKRLGLGHRISRYFEPEELVPAGGQGILAVQGRAGETYPFLDAVHDPDSAAAFACELGFLQVAGGGCTSPSAAYALVNGDTLFLRGFYVSEETGRAVSSTAEGPVSDAEHIGRRLAQSLVMQAAGGSAGKEHK